MRVESEKVFQHPGGICGNAAKKHRDERVEGKEGRGIDGVKTSNRRDENIKGIQSDRPRSNDVAAAASSAAT